MARYENRARARARGDAADGGRIWRGVGYKYTCRQMRCKCRVYSMVLCALL